MAREVAKVESIALNKIVPLAEVVDKFIKKGYERWQGGRKASGDFPALQDSPITPSGGEGDDKKGKHTPSSGPSQKSQAPPK